MSWTCGFNETRNYTTPKGGDCHSSLIKINCDRASLGSTLGEVEKDRLYMLGQAGVEMCPRGFARIMDEESCEVASKFFKLEYEPKKVDHDG